MEAYEFRTIDPNNGQLRNILDIAGSGGGGGGSVDLSNYYTKAETNNLFIPYYDSGEVDGLFTSYYTKVETDGLFTPYYTKVETDGLLNNKLNVSNPEITGVLKSNDFDSKNSMSNILFKHNNAVYLEYDCDYDTNGGLVLGKPLALASSLDIPLNSKLLFQHTDSYINETLNAGNFLNFVMKEQTGQIDFYVGDPATASNLVMTLANDLITFHKTTSPAIGGGGVDDTNLVKYTGETLQTIEGDLVIGGGAQFGSFDLTVNGTSYFLSGIELVLGGTVVLGTGKGYIRSINIGSGNTGYDYCIFASGRLHRFYVGGSPFPQHLKFQLSNTQAYFNVDVVCHTELQTDIINTKNAGNVDLVFKRGDVEYMKFEGTLQAVELTKGAKSNTYDSIGNADVSFRRNTIDFMYFRNGNVEVNTGISLLAESGKFDVIDSATPTNVVFKRGGVNFCTLDGTKNIIDVSTGRALSSQYIYGDYFYNRNYGADMVFHGSNTTNDGLAEYMRYRKADEDVNFSKDIYVNQDKKAYFHRETGKNSYIVNENTAGVNHFKLINEDPNGDIRFYANGGIRLFVTPSKVSVPAPYTLEGDLVDTSQKDMKYDIEEADFNFTKMVNSIKPHTFRMKEEKEMGITKTHIGFIAEDVGENIPEKVENILVEVDGIKKLSYVKMGIITWGAVREIIKENEELKNKVEHLETR